MHTPGPWYSWRTEVEGRKAWVVTAVPEEEWTTQHRVVATIYGNDSICKSNAELICKAPSNSKALTAAKRALSNPASLSKEDKKGIMSLAGVLGDSLQDDLARVRRRSKFQERTIAPMWRVFLALCVMWTVSWTCFWAVRFVVEAWDWGAEDPADNFKVPAPDRP